MTASALAAHTPPEVPLRSQSADVPENPDSQGLQLTCMQTKVNARLAPHDTHAASDKKRDLYSSHRHTGMLAEARWGAVLDSAVPRTKRYMSTA